MATRAQQGHLASQARRLYTEELVKGLAPLVQSVMDACRGLLDKPTEHVVFQRRRDLMQGLLAHAQGWHRTIVNSLKHLLSTGAPPSKLAELPSLANASRDSLSLVSDDAIDIEIVTSRLALAMMDRASWEFADLRSRVAQLEGRQELDAQDMLRAHVLARIVFEAWRAAGLTLGGWREVQATLNDEFSLLVEEAYHEVNRWLAAQGVMPEVDLRPLVRRSRSHPQAALSWQAGSGFVGLHAGAESGVPVSGMGSGFGPTMGSVGAAGMGASVTSGYGPSSGSVSGSLGAMPGAAGHASAYAGSVGAAAGGAAGARSLGGWQGHEHLGAGHVGDETRMMTRTAPLARSQENAEAMMGRLNRLVGRHVPDFGVSSRPQGARVSSRLSEGLSRAIHSAQVDMQQRQSTSDMPGGYVVTTPMMLEDLQQRKLALKKAAATPEERATIEIVALLFQSILTEDRIPASVRVWFARLQMPVLRVAVSEPDFFATVDHPARRLIDRMGACVMGFDTVSGRVVGESLGKEIKRIVQVVEAYPDTGRRVFQTVLTEFERFLEHYFRNENEATKKGVSLAQQVEQRETMAIQYTIELRRMLNEVPVQEGVRQFLFHVWADVLATTAVRYGGQSAATRGMKRAAADLIWSASAKVTREERAEVLRRLPPLLKSLREGMAAAGMDAARQDEQVHQLNNALAAAFSAKAAVIPDDRLREMMERLETLEELLPAAKDVQIDESMVLDLSGHQSSELEVVLEGGSLPTAAMVAWARELQVGSWFMLERQGRSEAVQLAWQGMRNQLSLFVTQQGRCVLFQQHRLASFLQAGLLLPAQDEALTVRATRSALAKLDVDGARLLN
jgi:hypothetical protein